MKKYIVFAFALALVLVGGAMASAQDSNNSGLGNAATGPAVLVINADGSVLLRGKVVSSDTTSLLVKTWGGTWKVKVASSTQLVSINKKLTDFVEGDFVGVKGVVSQDGDSIVDATMVREWDRRSDDDNDGIPNSQDKDDDNDGILDVSDTRPLDHDNDGQDDSVDSDDDNDNILDDSDENPDDVNNDGISDAREHHGEREHSLLDRMNEGESLKKFIEEHKRKGRDDKKCVTNTDGSVTCVPKVEVEVEHKASLNSGSGSNSSGSGSSHDDGDHNSGSGKSGSN